MNKEVDKQFKKILKKDQMLVGIINLATLIVATATDAIKLPYGKKLDKTVGSIATLNEGIEKFYSSNWH